jgi:hypothetical protein
MALQHICAAWLQAVTGDEVTCVHNTYQALTSLPYDMSVGHQYRARFSQRITLVMLSTAHLRMPVMLTMFV